MSFAEDGYTTVVDGYLFPDGVNGLAAACAARDLSCHYVVLTADLDTCWARANSRGEGRWPLEFQPFAATHEKFGQLDLDARHVVDATGSPESVRDAVLSAFRAGRLVVREQPSAPSRASPDRPMDDLCGRGFPTRRSRTSTTAISSESCMVSERCRWVHSPASNSPKTSARSRRGRSGHQSCRGRSCGSRGPR